MGASARGIRDGEGGGSRKRIPRMTGAAVSLLVVCACAARGQNGDLPYDKRISWFSYNADHPVDKRWSVHFDGSYRPIYGTRWRQWLVRPGVNLRAGEHWQLSFTYSYFSTHPEGLDTPERAVAEHRLHQQAEYSHRWGGNVIRHRFRLEERWISLPWQEGRPRAWKWQDRPRYMLRFDRPLRRNGHQQETMTLSFNDEILMSFRSPAASAFEQNRLYGGLTWRVGRHLAVDTGVFHQWLKPLNGGRLEHNLVFITLLRNTAPLKDAFGWLRRR